ncbi:hypothetical protein BD324DRAFT_480415 [Kockovaella imperatae]|uniref:Uncharacterized protein n=1 Tax=Kockovaella imperatae TaxID=4999 RepID=A0A1Y1UFC2_9TREE|nr:hypothetical protein BD324DRAFT_480415 [Kockovaella imperatae]ORX36204.1 hypothetical protein BD324DRAFT_480415 [Kockovaella imperatae]
MTLTTIDSPAPQVSSRTAEDHVRPAPSVSIRRTTAMEPSSGLVESYVATGIRLPSARMLALSSSTPTMSPTVIKFQINVGSALRPVNWTTRPSQVDVRPPCSRTPPNRQGSEERGTALRSFGWTPRAAFRIVAAPRELENVGTKIRLSVSTF